MAAKKSAIIPYRFMDEKLEILLITRSSGGGWGIPKGKVEPPLKAHTSATKEAFEEGGVLGYTHPISIGSYPDDSKSGDPIPTFLLEAEIELQKRSWPERKKRARLWVEASECEKYVTNKSLLEVIELGVACLRSEAEYFKQVIKTLCEENEWKLVAVDADYAVLEIRLEDGGTKQIRVTRSGSIIKLAAFGSIAFESEKELHAFSTELLQRNARNNIGCWCIEQTVDKFVYSCTHSMKLKLMDGERFAEVAARLAAESIEVESLMQKA